MARRDVITFGKYKRQMMRAAIELGYGTDVASAIEKCNNDSEVSVIMNRARRESMLEDRWKFLDKQAAC